MHEGTVARNYAEALLSLATKADNRDGFASMIRDVATAMTTDATVRQFMESPRVSYEQKNAVLAKAFGDRVPRVFLRFLETMVHNRRQMLIPMVATAYADLLDEAEGRVHADVTVSRAMDEGEANALAAQLSRTLGKTVVPHLSVNPEIMGGVVVKVGDTVMDGSVRRRLNTLAQRMRMSA
jgi:F-type H+-transporting ATPase subunit delta